MLVTNEFKFYNPNPTESTTASDCIIRAFCGVLDKSWDEVFDDLFSIAKEMKMMPHTTEVMETYLKQNGFRKVKSYNKDEITVGEFVKRNDGHYFLDLGWHVLSANNGQFFDLSASTGSCALLDVWRKD